MITTGQIPKTKILWAKIFPREICISNLQQKLLQKQAQIQNTTP